MLTWQCGVIGMGVCGDVSGPERLFVSLMDLKVVVFQNCSGIVLYMTESSLI